MFRNSVLRVLSYCRKNGPRVFLFLALMSLMCGLPLNCTGSGLNVSRNRDSLGHMNLALAKDINSFSWRYLKDLPEKTITDNGVVSPQSIYHCVAMAYIASGGKTRKQLADIIGFPKDNDILLKDMKELNKALNMKFSKDASVVLANGIWLDRTYATFRPEYEKQLEEYFLAKPKEIRFANRALAAKEINSWVSEKTKGKIKDIISPADLKSKSIPPFIINEPGLVAVNAVYFYSPWESGFEKEATVRYPFFKRADGSEKEVDVMAQSSELGYNKGNDYAILRLKYRHVPFSMYIVLPDKIMRTRELLQWAATHKELSHTSIPKTHIQNVNVLLPKFSLSSDYNVKKQLKNMGVKDAFNPSANFDKMIIKKRRALSMYISKIYQKATIDVDEEGTEAAAATSMVMFSFGCCATGPVIQYVNFHADHPFIFMIVHEPSNTILFNGWVSNP